MNSKTRQNGNSSIRCAVYTRKSTSEGLDQEFNTLDAQREAAEAFIVSQQHEGWVCLPEHYDDGGCTGSNMERPALKRLMAEVEVGNVDVVLVYKVDRLSRSLLDFARMIEVFDEHGVSFVSVTQQFNTATSMGRLILNVLLSFAQFEREMIAERTRDKMSAARRKGKWLGGTPVLGYDVSAQPRRLVVNPKEAARVRDIFGLYLKLVGLIPTVKELDKRNWVNKRWTTRKGAVQGGKPFNKGSLHFLLSNVTYCGKVKYQGQIYEGDHEPIVAEELFRAVRNLLKQNRCTQKPRKVNGCSGLLQGLLYCSACRSGMIPTYTTSGSRRYRYYVCSKGQKRGRDSCPSGSIPAGEIEQYVLKQLENARSDDSVCSEGPIESLNSGEQAEILSRLIRRVDYDGRKGDLHIRLTSGNTGEAK
jgi:site-specific DNA recombinase